MNSKLNVKLIAHTPEPDKVVAMAGKICYSPVGVEEIDKKLTPEEIEKFVNMLVNIKHESPLEHVSFTFAVEGISRACSHQLVRHRIASYSQQSQRYVKLEQFEYITPLEIENTPEAKEIFVRAMVEDQIAYNKLVDILAKKHRLKRIEELKYEYQELSDKLEVDMRISVKEYNKIAKEAEKKAIEDARYVFPNACETKIVFTMNGRSLINFLHHRCCKRSQDEIRELAMEMLKELREVAPILFKNVGAQCMINGKCNEGKMSCGKPYPRN